MNLHILGSSSHGNCYILETLDETLIIEAGVRMPEVKKALRFNLNKVVGAVISHAHNDHARYAKEMATSGVLVLANEDVLNTHGLSGKPFTKAIYPNKGYKIGGFKIFTIPVTHDVPCLAYVISHPNMGKLLFVTDTITLNTRVNGLNHIMIEANYADDILDDNIASDRVSAVMRPRLLNSHLEFEQTKVILSENDLSQVDNIILLHLSDVNSNEERFVREVREQTGKLVYAANKGMTINLSKIPY